MSVRSVTRRTGIGCGIGGNFQARGVLDWSVLFRRNISHTRRNSTTPILLQHCPASINNKQELFQNPLVEPPGVRTEQTLFLSPLVNELLLGIIILTRV